RQVDDQFRSKAGKCVLEWARIRDVRFEQCEISCTSHLFQVAPLPCVGIEVVKIIQDCNLGALSQQGFRHVGANKASAASYQDVHREENCSSAALAAFFPVNGQREPQ